MNSVPAGKCHGSLQLIWILLLIVLLNWRCRLAISGEPDVTDQATASEKFLPDPDSSRSLIPYRRVFIPRSQLSKITGLGQSFSLESMDAIAERLKQLRVDDATLPPEYSDKELSEIPLEISASIYSARLNGSRLVSSRSLLSASRGSVLGEQLPLSPWNLSISSVAPTKLRNDATPSSRYPGQAEATANPVAYDSLGNPLLSLRTELPNEVFNPKSFWIGWVLQGVQESSNRLAFKAIVPASKNSCILLTLPPHTTVEDATVPAVKISDLGTVEARLRSVPEEIRPTFERLPTDPTDQSLWLLELSGVREFSFRLTTVPIDQAQRGESIQQPNPYEHLVLDQINEHGLEGGHLVTKSQYEIQWNPSKARTALVVTTPPSAKVRRVQVMGSEVDWNFRGGVLSIPSEQIDELTESVASKVTLSVEIIEALHSNSADEPAEFPVSVILPPLAIQNGFVLKGKSRVDIGSQYNFASTNVVGGAYGESTRSSMRVFVWRDFPCQASVVVEPNVFLPAVRLLTKVSGSNGRVTTSARILFSGTVAGDVEFVVSPGWIAEDFTSGSLRAIGGNSDEGTRFLLDLNSLGTASPFLDARLRPAQASTLDSIEVPSSGLIRVENAEVNHLVIAENLPSQFSVDRFGRWTDIAIDSLTHSERAFVSSPDKCKVWRMHSGKVSIVERATPVSSKVKVLTRLERLDDKLVRVNHSIDFVPNNLNSSLAFRIDIGSQPWKILQSSGLFEIDQSTLSIGEAPRGSVSEGTVESSTQTSPQTSGEMSTESAPVRSQDQFIIRPTNVTLAGGSLTVLEIESVVLLQQDLGHVPLPRFLTTEGALLGVANKGIGDDGAATVGSFAAESISMAVSHSVLLDAGLSLVDEAEGNLNWKFLDQGDLLGERDSYESEIAVSCIEDEEVMEQSPIISQVSYNLALDPNEHARVDWQILTERLTKEDIEIELDEGWIVDLASLRATNSESTVFGGPVEGKPNQFRIIRTLGNSSASTSRDLPVLFTFTSSTSDVKALMELQSKSQDSLRDLLKSFVTKRIKSPRIQIDGLVQPVLGRLWLPKNSSWSSFRSDQLDDENLWSSEYGMRWWDRARDLLSGRPVFKLKADRQSAALPESLEHSFPPDTWRLEGTLRFASPGQVANAQGEATGSESMPQPERYWSILDIRKIQWISYAIFVVLVVMCIGTRRFSVRVRMLLYVAFVIGFSLPLAIGPLGETIVTSGLAALAVGLPLAAIFKSFESRVRTSTEKYQDGSTANWGSPNSRVKKSDVPLAGLLWLLLVSVVSNSQLAAAPLQTPAGESIDIIIPTDDTGAVEGDSAYVPNALLSALSGAPRANYLINSARHFLRINQRNRATTTPDLCEMNYDIWVGQLQPIRFPIGRNQGTLTKFTLDESDVTVGPRLQIQNEFIEWTPERIGRHSIQIRLTPTWVTDAAPAVSSSLRGERWTQQSAVMGVLPAASATLEIDSADPSIHIHVESLGGMANPSPGRYLVALGNLTSLQLETKVAMSATMPVTPTANGLFAALTLEYLFQGGHVRVMSNIHVPQGVAWSRTFTLEVDDAWVPVGSTWKGVTLISSRSASLVSRRQYVFEVDQSELEKPRFDLPILWGLRPRPVSVLNVLFMECIDHRVVPSIFRYGGHPGSEWVIESVRTWGNALTEKERFQWDDILATNFSATANPVVTSLRFPENTSYGIIRKVERRDNLGSRISARWSLLNDEQHLVVRMETVGSYNSDKMELVLPEGFQVVEARHNLVAFTVNQFTRPKPLESANSENPQVNDSKQASTKTHENIVQLIASREAFEGHEITLRAVKSGPVTNLSSPWLSIPGLNVSDYTMELSADENWLSIIHAADGSVKKIPGRGIQTPILLLNEADRVEVQPRPLATISELNWFIERSTMVDRYELTISGKSTIPPEANSKFTIEFPSSRFTSWRADRNETQVNSPIQDYTWVQVDAGTATDTQRVSEWRFTFPLTAEQLLALQDSAVNIRILEAPDFSISSAELSDWFRANSDMLAGQADSSLVHVESISTPNFFYSLPIASNSETLRKKDVFWLRTQQSSLTVEAPEHALELLVTINGDAIQYERENQRVKLKLPPLPNELMHELAFSYSSVEPSDAEARVNIFGELKLAETTYSEALFTLNNFLTNVDYYLPERMVEGSFAGNWLLNTHCSVVELEAKLHLDEENPMARLAKQNFLIHRAAWPELGWNQVPETVPLQFREVQQVEATVLQPTHRRLIYAFVTLALLAVMASVGFRLTSWPALMIVGLALPIWVISANWGLVLSIVGVAALIALDDLWLRRKARSKLKNRLLN